MVACNQSYTSHTHTDQLSHLVVDPSKQPPGDSARTPFTLGIAELCEQGLQILQRHALEPQLALSIPIANPLDVREEGWGKETDRIRRSRGRRR